MSRVDQAAARRGVGAGSQCQCAGWLESDGRTGKGRCLLSLSEHPMKVNRLLFFGAASLACFLACDSDEAGFVCPPDDAECIAAFYCGNDQLDAGEHCDSSDKYCSADCSQSHGWCGDGVVQADFGEVCDRGAEVDGAAGSSGSGADAFGMGLEGCAATCREKNGYVCDPQANTCGQTGVDADEIAKNHLEEVCTWVIGLLGGTHRGTYCERNGETLAFVAPELEDCMAELELDDECTIGEFEAWAKKKDRCEIYLEESVCHE